MRAAELAQRDVHAEVIADHRQLAGGDPEPSAQRPHRRPRGLAQDPRGERRTLEIAAVIIAPRLKMIPLVPA